MDVKHGKELNHLKRNLELQRSMERAMLGIRSTWVREPTKVRYMKEVIEQQQQKKNTSGQDIYLKRSITDTGKWLMK